MKCFLSANKIFDFSYILYNIINILSKKMNYDIIASIKKSLKRWGKRRREVIYIISYKPLFKLLLEKDMTKTQLRKEIGFSTSTLAKMSKDEYISLKVIDDICEFLECRIEEVVEVKHKKS